ncbi:MAG: winged helix-turn-helix domain-containing protein [Vicinamibacteria bacterium]
MITSSQSSSLVFGPFRLAPHSRALFKGAARVDIPPRYFDLLSFLIENRGRAVTKDNLYDHIWKDEIVTEGAIAQAIRFLRRALEDDARAPRYIRTVSKHGYEWIAAVEEESSLADLAPALPSEVISRGDEPVPPQTDELLEAFRYAVSRFGSASLGSAIAGAAAGVMGGVTLVMASHSSHALRVIVALATLGTLVGAAGGLGVGFGLSFAESLVRRSRWALLALAGGFSGGLLGALAHATVGEVFSALLNRSLNTVGGGYEGVWIGVFAGFGYGLATKGQVLAAPRSRARLRVVAITALSCSAGAMLGSLFGAHFTAASIDVITGAIQDSDLSLSPLGRWMGESAFGAASRAALSACEGLFFGAGLVYGLTRRPQSPARL